MSLRSVRSLLLPSATALLLGGSFAYALWQEPAGFQVRPVAGQVQWIEGLAGGNMALVVGDDGALLVDTYISRDRAALQAAVDAADGKGVRMVLNTHWHGDHTGNNPAWGPSATILAHENVRTRLLSQSDPKEVGLLPLVTYEDGVSLHVAGEDVRVRHYAEGHTDGDSVLYFPGSKVVHMGDLFFNGRFPYIDLDSGGSVRGLIADVREILDEIGDDWTIIPGHGPLAKKADLQAYLGMLEQTSALVEQGIGKKQSLADLEQADVLAPWKAWSWAFIDSKRYLGILYRDLSQGR